MANSVLQRISRNQSQSTIRILTQHNKPSPLLLTQIPKLSEPTDFTDSKPDFCSKTIHSNFTHVYPTFSFGIFLNPNLSPSLIRPQLNDEEEAEEEEDSKTIRADSVKKKRKKKMNKHKLRKLKKRIRRKTKT